MFNQLADSNKEKRLKRGELYHQYLKKKNQFIYMDALPTEQSTNDLLKQRQQMVKSQLSNSLEDNDRINLSSIIKYRLQSKKVQLPPNISSQMQQQIKNLEQQKIQPIIINNYLSRSSKYDSIKRQRKRKVKTYQDEDSESQEENEKYKQALKEIDDLNQLFFKNNKKRQSRIKNLVYQSPRMRRDFNHISRQKDFDKYIDYLDNRISSQKSQPKRQAYRPDTPIYKRFPQISPRKTEETNIGLRLMPVSNLQTRPQSKNTNDTFIKILKKVKARGESLLVKLNKFPSLRNISK